MAEKTETDFDEEDRQRWANFGKHGAYLTDAELAGTTPLLTFKRLQPSEPPESMPDQVSSEPVDEQSDE